MESVQDLTRGEVKMIQNFAEKLKEKKIEAKQVEHGYEFSELKFNPDTGKPQLASVGIFNATQIKMIRAANKNALLNARAQLKIIKQEDSDYRAMADFIEELEKAGRDPQGKPRKKNKKGDT